jgi:hypothetical protein
VSDPRVGPAPPSGADFFLPHREAKALDAADIRLKIGPPITGPTPEERLEQSHRDLLSACKQWRQATESRLRLITNREMSDSLLAPDKALFEAIDKAEGKT